MAYYTEEENYQLGLRHLGKQVRISKSAVIHNPEQVSIGDFSRVDDFCVISGQVSLGRNVMLSVFCNLAGGKPGINVGDFSTFAYRVDVFAQSDDYSGKSLTGPTVPREFKPYEKFAQVEIGSLCIIGTGATIFPGVRIPDGVAVGAQTVVREDLQSWGIYVGSPARRIKERDREIENILKRYLQS